MRKILYIDTAFKAGTLGGDKNRSRFIWETLSSSFDCGLLVLDNQGANAADYQGHKEFFSAGFRRGGILRPDAVFSFDTETVEKVKKFVTEGAYDAVFTRFLSAHALEDAAQAALPSVKIIADADMLFSRIAGAAWAAAPGVKGRHWLFQRIKLYFFERDIFSRPWLFLFTNPAEAETARTLSKTLPAPGLFETVPNFMPEQEKTQPVSGKYILFHGVQSSTVNKDAFKYLVTGIYPLMRDALEKHGIEIRVSGGGVSDFHREIIGKSGAERIKLTGEAKNIGELIAGSLFVFLPLRFCSGTITRVPESAAYGKAVLTTPAAAAGLGAAAEALVTGADARELAQNAAKMMSGEIDPMEKGAALRTKCAELFSADAVKNKLTRIVSEYAGRS